MDACAPRGSCRLRGRCRGAPDRQAVPSAPAVAGPGNLHLINGLYDCHRTRAGAGHRCAYPVAPRSAAAISRRRTRSICSRSAAITVSWCRIRRRCRASSRSRSKLRSRSPAYPLSIMPGDIALLPAEQKAPRAHASYERPGTCASATDVAAAARLLNDAQKVTILGGAGCRDAHTELLAMAERCSADGPRDARQGVCRVGQSVRRRHDRADRLFIRLLRHEGLRHAADAGHRLPLPQFYPQGGARSPDRYPAEQIGRRAPARAWPRRRCQRRR